MENVEWSYFLHLRTSTLALQKTLRDKEILKFAENLESKESQPSYDMNFVFSDNLSQNTLRLIYKIE